MLSPTQATEGRRADNMSPLADDSDTDRVYTREASPAVQLNAVRTIGDWILRDVEYTDTDGVFQGEPFSNMSSFFMIFIVFLVLSWYHTHAYAQTDRHR